MVVEDQDGVHTIAVIDGVTDKSGRSYDGMTGGARAAECIAATLERLGPGGAPAGAVAAVTADLVRLRRRWGVADDDPMAPAAVAAVLWPRHNLAWRVGDVHVAVKRSGRWEHHPGDSPLDRVMAGVRAAYLQCLLAEGHSPAELAAQDPGRHMLLPLLKKQSRLALREGPYGYGVLDGRPVPPTFIETFSLEEVTEVVLASDGYLSAAPDLAAAERQLAQSLAADPLRIGDHPSTKPIAPGASSFDDRTYVRVALHGLAVPAVRLPVVTGADEPVAEIS
ncbi:hypothetical protein HS048_33985 [Planomonospora sp. ID91781]|uniref:hypothetical protein n=1 Tax=Planomonospora sp. ID91781 TaxID=2738135 RepID=UPI0018C44583|nr:hypothetical protein [Planomonospora sp. ID91781]MBG0825697.1 hypothetical protein [Planomonospora sp. ID91781]